MTEWKRPPRHVFVHGSLEKNPPPVDYRPRLLNLLKHLQNAVSCLESLPIEGKGSLFGDELNTATWDAWRRLFGDLHFTYEVLKSDFGYQPGAICDHPVISRPANQAINWLGVCLPKLSNWMKKKEVGKDQKIPSLPANHCEVLKKAEEIVKNETQSIATSLGEAKPGLTPLGISEGEKSGAESLRRTNRKRGRKPIYDEEQDKRVQDAWRSGEHRNFKDLARELGISSSRDVRRAIDRHRKRCQAKEED